jgi:uncharacterized protein YecT (DUF1311 family)
MNALTHTFLFLCLLALPVLAAEAPDPELQRLMLSLESARTQMDMNLASKKLAEYWDAKLHAVDLKIEGRLDGKQRKEFAQSRKRWRSHRAGEVAFRASFSEGGSIQPLTANTAYSEITEHRVGELESLFSDVLSGRAKRAGAKNAVLSHRRSLR